MMRVLFLSARQIRMVAILVAIILLVAGIAKISETLTRRLIGVKPGVTVEGIRVGGMFRHELRNLLEKKAGELGRPPRNAMYFAESGEIIREEPGIAVDVEETLRHVLSAPGGTAIRLAVNVIQPEIDQSYFKAVYQGPENRAAVSLCVNVAWGEEFLPAILEIAAREQVRLTFFFVGTWVRQYPELVKKIAAAGHEVANHGMYHGHPAQMGRAELSRLISDNQQLLTQIIGKEPARLFAPPYGEVNERIVAVAAEMGFRTIMWSLDTVDWKRPNPETIVSRASDKARNGTIVLMHPTSPTVVALPRIIQRMKQAGYQVVPVGELLRT